MWRRRLSTWSSPTPLQQEAGWPSGLGLSSEAEGVERSGYKRKRAVTFRSPMPDSARSDSAGSLHLQNTPRGVEGHFYSRRALTESSDPSESEGSLDVSQSTNNSSAKSLCLLPPQCGVERAGSTSSEGSELLTLTSFSFPLFRFWEKNTCKTFLLPPEANRRNFAHL